MTNTIDIYDTTAGSDTPYRKGTDRYRKAQKHARKKKAVHEAQNRQKNERDDVRLPNGEPVRRRRHVGGQTAYVSAKVKEMRRSDRQTAHQQCLRAKYDDGETVVTGSLPVQRASVRSLVVAEV